MTAAYTHVIAGLPTIHRDPFDRMLIARAPVEWVIGSKVYHERG